jgi:hypothetical protein
MVLVLTGGREQGRSTGGSTGAVNLGAQLMEPAADEVSLGPGRTVLQIQGRRSPPAAETAIPQSGFMFALALAAVTVLFASERSRAVLLRPQPAPRGPPAG